MAMTSQVSHSRFGSTLEYGLSNLNLEGESKREEISQEGLTGRSNVIYSKGMGGIWRVIALNLQKIIGVSYDHSVSICTTRQTHSSVDFENTKVLVRHRREVLSVAKLSHKVFLTGSSDGSICFWHSTGRLIDEFKDPHATGFYSMTVLDREMVVTGACHKPKKHRGKWPHLIKVWNLSNKKNVFSLEGHNGGISGLVSLGHSSWIASSSADSTVKVWNIEERNLCSSFEGHKDYVYGLAVFQRHRIVTGGRDRTIRVIDVSSNQQIRCLEHGEGTAHTSTVYDVNVFNDVIVSGSRDGYVKVWDFRVLECIQVLDADDGFVYAANFTSDGKVIAGTSGKRTEIQGTKRQSRKSKKIQNSAHIAMWDLRFI